MTSQNKPGGNHDDRGTYVVKMERGEPNGQALARGFLEPHMRHALVAANFIEKGVSQGAETPCLMDYVEHIQRTAAQAEAGNIALASRLLVSQALTLDAMFTELARRSALNMGEHMHAAETYARLAMKAQSNSRATLEALAKVHQPREQTVRHVHVNEGGQAVIADNFHHHPRGHGIGKADDQSHATSEAGGGSTLLGQNPGGDRMPVPGGEGAATVQNARRKKPGRTKGQ